MKTSIETIIERLKENQTKEPEGIKELFGLARGVVLNLGEKSAYRPKLTSRLQDFFHCAKSVYSYHTFLNDQISIDYTQHNIYGSTDALFIEMLRVYENGQKRFGRTIALHRPYNNMPHGTSTNYSHLDHFERGAWEERIKELSKNLKQKN